MDLKEIENQLKEIQKIDFQTMSADEIQKIVDQLLNFADDTETQLNNEIKQDETKNS